MFVAVVPPDDATSHLAAALEPLRRSDSGPRCTLPEQWHVTLAFLPSVREAHLDELTQRLGRIAARRAAVDLALVGGGAFPQRSRARVLWVGVETAGDDLRRLATASRAAAVKAGTDVGGGRFRAHMTLARLSEPRDATSWVEQLSGYRGPRWTATSVHLVRSHLGGGPGRRSRYETVASFALPPRPG